MTLIRAVCTGCAARWVLDPSDTLTRKSMRCPSCKGPLTQTGETPLRSRP